MFISAVRKRRVSITAAALLAAGLVVPALPTAAAEPAPGRNVSYLEFMWKETLMGAFFTSDADHSDVLYYSDDGKRFDELAVAYQDKYPHDPTRDISTQGSIHHTLGDPSIMYHDGAFWMLSAWQRRDGKFWPTIGVSQDGKSGLTLRDNSSTKRNIQEFRCSRPPNTAKMLWRRSGFVTIAATSTLFFRPATSVFSMVAPTKTKWFLTW